MASLGSSAQREAAFFSAAASGDVEGIIAALAAGQDARALSPETSHGGGRLTALMIASKGGHTGAAVALVAADPGLVPLADAHGVTACHLACLFGRAEVLGLLLDASPALAEARTADDGKAPLHCACQAADPGGSAACVALLLSRGASANARDASGGTPLMAASAAGRLATVRLLAEPPHGADLDAVDGDGDSALAHGGGGGHGEVVAYLLARGASCDFYTAALVGQAASVAAALEAGQDANATDDDGCTALMGAAAKGHVEVKKGPGF